jgi:hypothetical protein
MDRYDAILEHLKKAQTRGRDSIANRLDSAVASLEELINTAKSTIQDALPTEAEDVLPVAEVEAMVAELRSQPSPTTGITLENLRVLEAARSQSELLRSLLPMLTAHVGRAVVLVIREAVVTAWSGVGFADSDRMRSWNGGVAASADFQRLVETARPLRFAPASDPLLSEWLAGQEIPSEAVLLPISLRGKLMGMIYIDHQGDQPWDVDAAQALTAVACWLIDTLQHRTTVPSPMLAEIEDALPAAEMEPPEVEFVEPEPMEEEPVIEFEDEPSSAEFIAPPVPETELGDPPEVEFEAEVDVPEAIEFEPGAPEVMVDPTPTEPEEAIEVDYDFEPAPAEETPPDAGFDPSATVRVEVGQDLMSPDFGTEPEPAPEAVAEPPAEVAAAVEPPPVASEIEAPPPVRPIEPPIEETQQDDAQDDFGRSAEDEARLEEARRFARLLVSEIKLYNEEEVDRGRAAKDLGVRLKEDIERSREMYEKRISPEIRQNHDYFQDELVRILADGDAEALNM